MAQRCSSVSREVGLIERFREAGECRHSPPCPESRQPDIRPRLIPRQSIRIRRHYRFDLPPFFALGLAFALVLAFALGFGFALDVDFDFALVLGAGFALDTTFALFFGFAFVFGFAFAFFPAVIASALPFADPKPEPT